MLRDASLTYSHWLPHKSDGVIVKVGAFIHVFSNLEWNGNFPLNNFAHKVFLPMSLTVQNGMGICP